MDPMPRVPTHLYIGRGDRVTARVNRLTYWISSLLHDMHSRLFLDIVKIHLSWFAYLHVGQSC